MPGAGHLRLWPALFAVSVFTSFFSAFMWAEDAFLLFNRYNAIDGARPWVAYNGYVSLHPHAIAWFASYLPVPIQPLVYAATAGGIFLALLIYITKIIQRLDVIFLIVAYFLLFDRVHFVNMTFSLWSSAMLVGAIFLYRLNDRSKLSTVETSAVLVFQFSSPITVALAPLIIAHAATMRDKKSWMLTATALPAALLVLETGSNRIEISLYQAVASIAKLPLSPFIFHGQFPGTGVNWLNAVGLVIFLFFVATLMFTTYTVVNKGANRNLWLFDICTLGMTCIYFLTPGFSNYPAISGRYVFPATIALAISLGVHLPRLPRWATSTVVAVALSLAITAILIRWERIQWGYDALALIWSWDRNSDEYVETAPISRQIGASLVLLRIPTITAECVDLGAAMAPVAAKAYCGNGKYHLFTEKRNEWKN